MGSGKKIALRSLRQVCPDGAAMDRLKLLIEMVRNDQAKAPYEYDVWFQRKVKERFVS